MEQTTVKASLSYIEGITVRSAFTSFTVKLSYPVLLTFQAG